MKCPQCPEIIYKKELEEHIEEEHSTSKCLYCQIELKNELLENHVIICGSRTEKCGYCLRNITRLEFADHIEICAQVFNKPTNGAITVQNHSSEKVRIVSNLTQNKKHAKKPAKRLQSGFKDEEETMPEDERRAKVARSSLIPENKSRRVISEEQWRKKKRQIKEIRGQSQKKL